MERSSSQTRMLATRTSCSHGSACGLQRSRTLRREGTGRDGCGALGIQAAQPQDEGGALARFRSRPHFSFVRLHDLINDGQAQSGAAFKVRLERLEDFLDLLCVMPMPVSMMDTCQSSPRDSRATV